MHPLTKPECMHGTYFSTLSIDINTDFDIVMLMYVNKILICYYCISTQ